MHNEELVKAYQNGDNTALEELIKQNDGIIKKICNKYYGINKELEFDDLLQDGRLGLMYAAEHYDASKENAAAFITYAVYFINRFICNAVNGQTSKDKGNNEIYNNAVSIYEPLQDAEDKELIDTIADNNDSYDKVEFKIYIGELHNELNKLMSDKLTLQEREVIQFRYGWDGKTPATLKETGEILNKYPERIRTIENRALRMLRHTGWAATVGQEYAADLIDGYKPGKINIGSRIEPVYIRIK